ncbi:flagellar FliJ family protein [Paeniglutamicibacter sp.]|uniref:flagellar FliJ family protein n=1 Tax=Paeniglutamicibacter sp. TaxID=1934391 RepID=UPI0039894BF4
MSRGFALSGLLRLRGLQETKAAGDLAAANRGLRQRTLERNAMRDAMASPEQAPVDSATLMALVASRASARGMLLELDTLVSALDGQAEDARENHRQARKELKALEKLADRHEAKVRTEALSREQLLLDDLGATNAFEGKTS